MTKEETTEVREFEGIEVTYPPEDICTYPEYKGKPYFGIRYRENGESIVGYGTYNPQVLSRYLKDYFMSTTKNDIRDNRVENELNRVKDELEPRKLEQEHDKPMVEIDLYSVIKQSYIEREVLDKIRAEIMQLDYDIEFIDYDYNDMAQTEEVHTIYREEVLQIIDKHKAESEGHAN